MHTSTVVTTQPTPVTPRRGFFATISGVPRNSVIVPVHAHSFALETDLRCLELRAVISPYDDREWSSRVRRSRSRSVGERRFDFRYFEDTTTPQTVLFSPRRDSPAVRDRARTLDDGPGERRALPSSNLRTLREQTSRSIRKSATARTILDNEKRSQVQLLLRSKVSFPSLN